MYSKNTAYSLGIQTEVLKLVIYILLKEQNQEEIA